MEINLNDATDFTIDRVGKLIASKDDSEHRQLRVAQNGIAYLSDIVGSRETEGLAFRFETFVAGNNYVGHRAGSDIAWVTRIYDALRANWPVSTQGTYIDVF